MFPAVMVAGPVFVMARSVEALVDTVEVAELLPGVGSVVVEETVAVLLMLPLKAGATV